MKRSLLFSDTLSVFDRGHLAVLSKALCQVALGGKSGQVGDGGNIVVRIFQKILAHFNAPAVQVVNRRDAVIPGEFVAEIVFVQMGQFCQGVQGNLLTVAGVQIALDLGALPAWMKGGNQLESGYGNPPQLHNENSQGMAADFLIAWIFLVQLCEKGVEIKLQVCLFLPAVKNLELFLIVKRETDPVHAYCEIGKGRCVSGSFRVLDVGIHNDQVIFGDGEGFVLDHKFPASFQHIEQFCKGVGVGNAGPVIFIPGKGSVHKNRFLGKGIFKIEGKRACTHGVHLLNYFGKSITKDTGNEGIAVFREYYL